MSTYLYCHHIARFGIQGSGVKYNAHALWRNWTDVTNWVCSYYPINSALIYDCIPEVRNWELLEGGKTKVKAQF